MPSAARLGDLIGHAPPIPPSARGPGGPGGVPTGLIIGPCSGNVFVNGIPAARSGVDMAVCSLHPPVPLPIASGSSNVFINGRPAARLGDLIKCSAIIVTGSGNVFIGGGGSGASGTVQTDVLIPERETEPVILQSLEGSDAGADSLGLDEHVPPMSYGEQMGKVGGFVGDLALGAGKGLLNLIPETLAFAYRMSGYAIAGVASHFDADISYAMFAKYEKVTGRFWQYENSVQEFGGVAAQLASPMIARGATTVGAVIYNAEIGALRIASAEGTVTPTRQLSVINPAGSSGANSAAASGERFLLNAEGSQLRGANGKFVNTLENDLPDPTNLSRAELRQTGDGRWKIFGSGEPRTPKGSYNFVSQDGKVYVGTGDSFQGHIDIARGNAVDYAGQISFGSGKSTKGVLNSWDNASGHYLPEPIQPSWADSVRLPIDKFKAYKHD